MNKKPATVALMTNTLTVEGHVLPDDGAGEVSLPEDARFLHVGTEQGAAYLYVCAAPEAKPGQVLKVYAARPGQPIPVDHPMAYLGHARIAPDPGDGQDTGDRFYFRILPQSRVITPR